MEYKHNEAFALMWYGCKCGHRERIWNSRDGVTPFGTRCPSCGDNMLHIEWGKDIRALDHKLVPMQKFWRDGTPDEAVALMTRRFVIMEEQGFPMLGKEQRDMLLAEARSGDAELSDFRKGWPMLDIFRG